MYVSLRKLKVLPLLFFVLLISCRFEVPVSEMVEARKAIIRAREVMAEKYAPEDLKKADAGLRKAHDYVVEKDENNAKKSAADALGYARKAIDVSLPLLARDSIDYAKKAYAEAEKAGANFFAQDQMKNADGLINSAVEYQNNNDFWQAHITALKAEEQAQSAKVLAEERAREIPAIIEETNKRYSDLASEKYSSAAEKELSEAEKSIILSGDSYKKEAYEIAVSEIEKAQLLLDSAEGIIIKTFARDELDNAAAELTKSREMDESGKHTAKLDEADNLIKNGEEKFTAAEYQSAAELATDARKLIAGALLSLEQDIKLKSGLEAKTAEKRIYVVKWRKKNTDCLWRIAQKVYSDARLWPLIYMANKDQIKDPDLIFPGQKFTIPPVPEKKKVEADATDDEVKDVKPSSEAEAESPASKDAEAEVNSESSGDSENTTRSISDGKE